MTDADSKSALRSNCASVRHVMLHNDGAATAYKVHFDSSDTLREWDQSEIANDTDGSNTEGAGATR